MKRSLKNIITISVAIICAAAVVFTVIHAKNSLAAGVAPFSDIEPGEIPEISENDGENGAEPPEIPGEMTNGAGGNGGETPPGKPEGDAGSESMPEMPADSENGAALQNNENADGSTPPEKPEGDAGGEINAENGNSGDNPQGGENMPAVPGMTDNGMTMPGDIIGMGYGSALTFGYYVALGVETLLFSLTVMYLVLSGFNKKGFKETFCNRDKIIIYILAGVLLTAALTAGTAVLTNNIILRGGMGIDPADIDPTDFDPTDFDPNKNPGENGNGGTDITYSAATEITENAEVTGENYFSGTADQNALSVSGDISVSVENATVTKGGDSDGGDNTSFYGINSAVIARNGAKLILDNISVITNAVGANGVFSYGGSATTAAAAGDGTTVTIKNSTITTTKDNSGGIMTTGGGTTLAENLTVNTTGVSSAAIRTDRGGGNVTVTGGTYTTKGLGSPAVYSTANVTVRDAALIAEASEGIIIEGKNSVTIENCTVTDTNSGLNGQSTSYKNIFLYQSMSGDADTGVAGFTALNSVITTNRGDSFYVTNTTAEISLSGCEIINNDSEGNFLRVKADSWGNSGSNGGDVTLIMNGQTASGNVVIDNISTLSWTMTESAFEGTVNGDNTAKNISLKMDKNSSIRLTGDWYVSSLEDEDTSYSNIDFNGYKLYVNGTTVN